MGFNKKKVLIHMSNNFITNRQKYRHQNLARLGTYVEESKKDVCHNILQVFNLTIDNTNDVNMEEMFEEISYIITRTN